MSNKNINIKALTDKISKSLVNEVIREEVAKLAHREASKIAKELIKKNEQVILNAIKEAADAQLKERIARIKKSGLELHLYLED